MDTYRYLFLDNKLIIRSAAWPSLWLMISLTIGAIFIKLGRAPTINRIFNVILLKFYFEISNEVFIASSIFEA